MEYNIVPYMNTGDALPPEWWNTYVRDNFAALVPFAASGDMWYADAPTTLAKLAKPSVTSVCSMDSTGVMAWALSSDMAGMLHTKGTVDFNPEQNFASSSYADINDATLTLTTTKTCSIFVKANVVGYSDTNDKGFFYVSSVAGSVDAVIRGCQNICETAPRNEATPYQRLVTGVAAGNIEVKLVCRTAGTGYNNYVTQGRMIAFAFVE
jgi:hypothetical protein